MQCGYVLIVSPDESVSPGVMDYDDFMLMWDDAYKQNPKRWTEPPPFVHSPGYEANEIDARDLGY